MPSQDGEEQTPTVPSPDLEPVPYPGLSRDWSIDAREVKAMLEDKNAPPAKRAQVCDSTCMIKWMSIDRSDISGTSSKSPFSSSNTRCMDAFEHSRSYAQHPAALTTFHGREILKETCELAEKHSLEIVYGDTDTDSVFAKSNQNTVEEALEIAHQLKKEVNGRYRLLEIDVDGVFQRLLLLQKESAAIKIESDKPPMENKGLDMEQREYCGSSKNTSEYVPIL